MEFVPVKIKNMEVEHPVFWTCFWVIKNSLSTLSAISITKYKKQKLKVKIKQKDYGHRNKG